MGLVNFILGGWKGDVRLSGWQVGQVDLGISSGGRRQRELRTLALGTLILAGEYWDLGTLARLSGRRNRGLRDFSPPWWKGEKEDAGTFVRAGGRKELRTKALVILEGTYSFSPGVMVWD